MFVVVTWLRGDVVSSLWFVCIVLVSLLKFRGMGGMFSKDIQDQFFPWLGFGGDPVSGADQFHHGRRLG